MVLPRLLERVRLDSRSHSISDNLVLLRVLIITHTRMHTKLPMHSVGVPNPPAPPGPTPAITIRNLGRGTRSGTG